MVINLSATVILLHDTKWSKTHFLNHLPRINEWNRHLIAWETTDSSIYLTQPINWRLIIFFWKMNERLFHNCWSINKYEWDLPVIITCLWQYLWDYLSFSAHESGLCLSMTAVHPFYHRRIRRLQMSPVNPGGDLSWSKACPLLMRWFHRFSLQVIFLLLPLGHFFSPDQCNCYKIRFHFPSFWLYFQTLLRSSCVFEVTRHFHRCRLSKISRQTILLLHVLRYFESAMLNHLHDYFCATWSSPPSFYPAYLAIQLV